MIVSTHGGVLSVQCYGPWWAIVSVRKFIRRSLKVAVPMMHILLEEEGHFEESEGAAGPLGGEGFAADVDFGAAGDSAHGDAGGEVLRIEFDLDAEDVGTFALHGGGEDGGYALGGDCVAGVGPGIEDVFDFDAGVGFAVDSGFTGG